MWVALLVAPLMEGNEDTQSLPLACLHSRAVKVIYAGGNWWLLLLTDIRTQLLQPPKTDGRPVAPQNLPGLRHLTGIAKAFGCERSSRWVSSLSMKVAIAVLRRLCCVNQPGKLL